LRQAFLAVKIAQHIAPGNYDLAVVAAVAAILGHVFPIWLGFRGGKGVASALGVFLALSPAAAGCTFAIFLIVVLLTRYVSLASIVGSAFFPLFGLYFAPVRTPMVIAGFLFIPLLIIVKHRENVRRLLSGTENRFGSKKVSA
jgi:glycerol-3-phosphate acyltransferase PlsY